MCVDRAVLVGMRRPRLERKHALCEPCVSRTGSCPSVCGRRTRAELHIQDIGPRMLPSSAAPGQRACCRHYPWCSFPCSSALGAHGTLHSPGRGKHLRVLCTTNPEVRRCLRKKGPPGRMGQQRLFVMSLNKLRGRPRRRNSPLWSCQKFASGRIATPHSTSLNVTFVGA